jgi:hypothetical protein
MDPPDCDPDGCSNSCVFEGFDSGECVGDECECFDEPPSCDPVACGSDCTTSGYARGECVDDSCECSGYEGDGVAGQLTSGCGEPRGDIYAVPVSASDEVYVRADTTLAATASDLSASIGTSATSFFDSVVASGDDDVPCTHPPPSYSCPEMTWTVTSGLSTIYIAVLHASHSCADADVSDYVLYVTVDGTEVLPTLHGDEVPF